MRTIVALSILCLLVTASWAADYVVQTDETWQDIVRITENRPEALRAMNSEIDSPQAGQSIHYVSRGDLDELKHMFVYEYGGLRLGLLWIEIFPNGETRAKRLDPWDYLTLTMKEDARLWCQKMLTELTEADADYPYYHQRLQFLEGGCIWQIKPPSPPGYIAYYEIYKLAEHWRTWARE